MDRQSPFYSVEFGVFITPENVVQVARLLCALDKRAFKRTIFSKSTKMLKLLQTALHHYQNSRLFRKRNRTWMTRLEQDLAHLIALTRSVIILLKPAARYELFALLPSSAIVNEDAKDKYP